MKNKIKILSIIVAMSFALVACTNNGGETTDETKTESVEETQADGETMAEEDNSKPVSIENLRDKDTPFLSVGDQKVSYSTYYKYYDLYAGVLALQQKLDSNVANLLVRDIIVTQDLEKEGVEISQEELDAEVQKFVANLGSESDFNRYINTLGTTKEIFEENIKNSLKNNKHKEIFASKQTVSDKEIDEYYEKNKNSIDSVNAKHILVKDEDTAKEVASKLNNGEDFKKVSDEYSVDEAAKQNGGELGDVTRDKFDKDFADAVFELEDGKISEPIKTQFGYHIVVMNKNNVGKEKHLDSIKQKLANDKYEAEMKDKIAKSEIKFFDYDGEELNN